MAKNRRKFRSYDQGLSCQKSNGSTVSKRTDELQVFPQGVRIRSKVQQRARPIKSVIRPISILARDGLVSLTATSPFWHKITKN